jgi:tRNA dimethylallyltransferase
VLENWVIPRVEPDLALRRELEKQAECEGVEKLFSELKRLDPDAASRIDPRNPRRLIRALEISLRGGARPGTQPPPFEAQVIGLTMPRAGLYQRIDARIKAMMDAGLVDEVKKLLDMGYGPDLPSMSGIGYRQVIKYIQGEMSLPEAIESINIDSHRLVRQQYNWFKPADGRIHWFDASCGPYGDIARLI